MLPVWTIGCNIPLKKGLLNSDGQQVPMYNESTKWTTICHYKSLNTKRKTTHVDGDTDTGLLQSHHCDGVTPLNGIPSLSFLIIGPKRQCRYT